MLELRMYKREEIAEILRTSTDKQQITRALNRLPLTYTCSGWGESLTFTIESITNPFQLYCIQDLEFNSRTNFTKLRNLFYYLFCVEGFAEMPMSEMELWLSEADMPVSRRTISNYLKHMERINFIKMDKSDCIYYKIERIQGRKVHTEIDRETYNNAWKIYFEKKEESDSATAYETMCDHLGGHPYRKPKILCNAFYLKETERLIGYVNEAFDE